jgi:hypothetical protein
MGLISKILSYTRIADRFGAKVSDVKHDPGGGANQTGEHFQGANEDSVPLPGDYLVTINVQRTGGEVVVGFIDPKQQQTAEPGEHRQYARDASGVGVVQLHLKKDGSAILSNANGSTELKQTGEVNTQNANGFYKLLASGVVDINGFTIATDGSAVSPVSVTAPTVAAGTSLTKAGVEVADQDHDHGAGSLLDSGAGQVTGTTAQSNG